MSQAEDAAKQHTLPPPSYEEAVFGNTSADIQNSNPTFTEAPSYAPNTTQAVPYSPQQFPTTQYNAQPYNTQNYLQQNHTPMMYNMCPPGAEPLLDLSEILVYPSRGRVYKIKDQDKTTILNVKLGFADECCNCCNSDNYAIYTLRSVDGQMKSARANLIIDSMNCCSYSPRHLEVQAPLDVPMGIVRATSNSKARVENLSGDVLYELQREKSCCEMTPYQISTPGGHVVGHIDPSRGVKHRLMLPKEMPVNHKILLLFFTVTLQTDADSQRRNN